MCLVTKTRVVVDVFVPSRAVIGAVMRAARAYRGVTFVVHEGAGRFETTAVETVR